MTAQGKLYRREYPTVTPVESDLRRMVGNAKSFNQKSSEIFSDAEKIRKAIVAFMTQNNPAYKDPNYTPAPTPVPEGWQDRLEEQDEPSGTDAEGETDQDALSKQAPEEVSIEISKEASEEVLEKPDLPAQVKDPLPVKASDKRRATSTPGVLDADGAGESFEGDTFQQAQEKIVTEMINLKNDEYVSYVQQPILTDVNIQ